MGLSHNHSLLLYTLLAVVALVVLVSRYKVNSFIALTIASLFIGLSSGMDIGKVGEAFQEGVGAVLKDIAMVVGLGTVLGKMLAESGGAEQIANTLIKLLGEKRLPWTMMLIAFIVGIPVFFGVGLVLLVPILFSVAKETKKPFLLLAIPVAAGLSVVHGFVPPHPGPMAAVGILKADIGKTILYSLILGFPIAVVCGPVFAYWIAPRVPVELSGDLAEQFTRRSNTRQLPGFGITVFTILLPVLLMLFGTLANLTLAPDSPLFAWSRFISHPVVALLIATLFSFYSFGYACGFNREQILKFSNDCVGPVAAVLLVVGAGGGFNKVLVYSGVGDAIKDEASGMHLSPLILGWLAAALIRVATGSATVAITTAAGIMTPIIAGKTGVNLELLVLAMGAGSLILSHVNDGGFWFVKEYFNLSVAQTLKSWTVMETLISLLALALILLLNLVIK